MNKILIFLGFFLITLQSIYIPVFGPVCTFIGYILLFTCALRKSQPELNLLALVMAVYLILVIHLLLSLSSYGNSDFGSFLSLVVMISALPVLISFFKKSKDIILKCVKLTIAFHAVVLVVQIIWWIITKDYLDLLALISNQQSGTISKKGISALGYRVPRFSGLFNEPGTYSVTLMTLIFVYYSISKSIDEIVVLGTVTCLATMSMFGIVLVTVFFLIILFSSKISKVKVFIYVLMLFVAFLGSGGGTALLSRFSVDSQYSGIGFREQMLNFLYSNSQSFIFGIPVSSYPDYFVPNDIGLWFSFITTFGIWGALILILLYFYTYISTKKIEPLLILTIILLTKLKFTYPLFWLVFILLSVDFNKKYENEAKHEKKY